MTLSSFKFHVMLDGKAKNALTSLWLLLVYNYHIYDYIVTTEYYSPEKNYHSGFCLERVVDLKMF